jgi:hypothetical protein
MQDIILPVVLYGLKTWSLTLREKHRLRMPKGIFGPKRDDMTGRWRKLHNKEVCNLCSSSSIIRMIKLRRRRQVGNAAVVGVQIIARRGKAE